MDRATFDASHVYSKAPEGGQKRVLDEQIMGGDYSKGDMIDMHSEAYVKELIKTASKGKVTVSNSAKGLQFYIIKGGGEGFLDAFYKDKDANRVVLAGKPTTTGAPGDHDDI